MAARQDDAAEALQMAGETDEPSIYDDHHAIWNLDRMARLNLKPPEWIEDAKKDHYESIASLRKIHEYLENDDSEVADEATMAEFDQLCANIFANVDLSGLNTAGGESGGMDAVGVYGWKPRPLEQDLDDDAADAAAETEPST